MSGNKLPHDHDVMFTKQIINVILDKAIRDTANGSRQLDHRFWSWWQLISTTCSIFHILADTVTYS